MSTSAHSATASLPASSRKGSSDNTNINPTNSNTIAATLGAPTIHAIAKARIYHTHLDPKHSSSSSGSDEWIFSRLKGTLTFGRNWSSSLHGTAGVNRESVVGPSGDGGYWFTLADDMTGKTIWMFHIPSSGFFYEVDRPFFHVFNGRTRKYGFLFDDDEEASLFMRKVITETCKTAHTKRGRRSTPGTLSPRRSKSVLSNGSSTTRSFPLSSRKFRSGSITISAPAPNSFRHISHVGVNAFGVFEISRDLDGAFKESLIRLSGAGMGGEEGKRIVVLDNSTFLESFWKDVDSAVERGAGGAASAEGGQEFPALPPSVSVH